jgi:hypothetical protein
VSAASAELLCDGVVFEDFVQEGVSQGRVAAAECRWLVQDLFHGEGEVGGRVPEKDIGEHFSKAHILIKRAIIPYNQLPLSNIYHQSFLNGLEGKEEKEGMYSSLGLSSLSGLE